MTKRPTPVRHKLRKPGRSAQVGTDSARSELVRLIKALGPSDIERVRATVEQIDRQRIQSSAAPVRSSAFTRIAVPAISVSAASGLLAATAVPTSAVVALVAALAGLVGSVAVIRARDL